MDQQELIFSGMSLDNDRSLSSYNIQRESTIHLVVKVSSITSMTSMPADPPKNDVTGRAPPPGRPHPWSADVANQRNLTLTISIQNGRQVVLNVDRNESVYELKQLIHNQEGIPPDQQLLVCAGSQLQDGRLLCDYGITFNCTLQMMFSTSSRMHLFIKTLHGNTYILYPSKYQTVNDVKLELGVKENIDTTNNKLIYQGRELEDDKQLVNCNIPTQCTVHLIKPQTPAGQRGAPPAAQATPILVRTLVGDMITVMTRPGDRVRDVKLKLKEKENYPIEHMSLLLGGTTLRDDAYLTEYRLQQDSTLLVKFDIPPSLQISAVNMLTNEVAPIEGVAPNDSIVSLQDKIRQALRIQTPKLTLVHSGGVLNMNLTIDQTNIVNETSSIVQVYSTKGPTFNISVSTMVKFLSMFQVCSSEQVSALKFAIQEKTGLHPINQVLISKGKVLQDTSIIEDVFSNESTSNVVLFTKVGIQLKLVVCFPNGSKLNLSMESHHTIDQVKFTICNTSREQLPGPSQLLLRHNGIILENHYCIGDYILPDSALLTLTILSVNNITFHAKTRYSKVSIITVDSQSTVSTLRMLIGQQLEGVSPENLHLYFCGDEIYEEKSLANFGFPNPCPLLVDY